MNKSRVVGLVLLMVSMIGFAILSYSHVTSYLSQTGDHPVNFLTHFATVLAALLSTVAGFGISYFFFYKGKLAELNDFNFKACANYDVVIRELRNLKNPHVNNILLEYSGTIEAPELYVYDSFFLEFAALFAGCPKSERKRLINNLKTQIIPPKHYTKSTPCATPGCPGILELSMRKGEHYRVRCNDCNTVYACSVTKNDKIACRPIPGKHKRLTFTNFDNELGSYLTRIKALISKTDMALIAKKAVNMINNDPETTYYRLKKDIVKDKELWTALDDIDDAVQFVNILLKSKAFFKDPVTGQFTKYNKPLNMKTSEKDAYISYIKFVAYKIKEDRQLNVDRKVVKKLIRTLIPDRIIDDTNINETTREILLHIVSADKYDDWETDAP